MASYDQVVLPDPVPLSALQHAVYCLRQAALIHLEMQWAENRFTAEGDVLHAVADKGGNRHVRGIRRVMSLPLACRRLNLSGIADVVEFRLSPEGTETEGTETAFPVEYKRGKPKLHRADEVQLCAQALCLEEMTGHPVPEGALFYAQPRRRVEVPFDEDLRHLTEETVRALAGVLQGRVTPPPTSKKSRCRACSLYDLCQPEMCGRAVRLWRHQMVTEILAEVAQ